MFQSPVTEGYNDVVELQPLALMDGKHADAIRLGTLYRLGADGIVPFFYESIDVGGVFLCEAAELVVESTDVGTLFLKFV